MSDIDTPRVEVLLESIESLLEEIIKLLESIKLNTR